MLAAISLYRLPDFIMGPMANPYYHDLGLSKQTVGAVRGSIGLIATFAGIAAGGFCSLKLGYMRALIIGGILQAAAIAAYATLAFAGTSIRLFALVMAGDNFGISFAGVALVAYMSSLTNLGYTATQYALLSSTYAWLGKILKGFSGVEVESLSTTHRPHSRLRHFLYRLRTDRRACRPSVCGIGLLAQAEATGRSRCLAKSSRVAQAPAQGTMSVNAW